MKIYKESITVCLLTLAGQAFVSLPSFSVLREASSQEKIWQQKPAVGGGFVRLMSMLKLVRSKIVNKKKIIMHVYFLIQQQVLCHTRVTVKKSYVNKGLNSI